MKNIVRTATLLFILAIGIPASAVRIVITGPTNVRDTTIYSDNVAGNSGGATSSRAGRTGMSGLRRALTRFDLSSIPSNATVTSATLQMTLVNVPMGAIATTETLKRLTNDWTEGTGTNINGEPVAGAASWSSRQQGTLAWTTAGGDFITTTTAQSPVGIIVNATVSWSSPRLTADVQGWVDSSLNNYGWIMIGDEATVQSVRGFGTAQATTGQPTLAVEYTIPPLSAIKDWLFFK